MLEFKYTNRGPRPWAKQRTNMIRLRWDGKNLVESRHYISTDGSFDETGIEHTFDNTGNNRITVDNVAKMIHWGCCGWAAGGHEVWQLKERIEAFVLNPNPNPVMALRWVRRQPRCFGGSF